MTDHTDTPSEGYFLHRQVLGKLPNGRNIYGPYTPIRIAREITPDPFYDNPQDRSPVIHVYVAEDEIEDHYLVWPFCAGNKIEPDAYWSFVNSGRE